MQQSWNMGNEELKKEKDTKHYQNGPDFLSECSNDD